MSPDSATGTASTIFSSPFEGFFSHHNAMMLLMDETGKIIDANDMALSFYGYSLQQMITMNIGDINLFSPDELKTFLHQSLTNTNKHFKRKHRLATGDNRDVEVSTTAVEIDTKKLLFAIIYDRTGYTYVSKALLTSQERYRLIFNNGNDALFVMRINEDGFPGFFTDVNIIACDRLEYSRDELLRMSPKDIDEEGIRDTKNDLKKLSENGQAIFERVHVSKSGKKIPVEISSKSFIDNGKRYDLSIARDITERKKMEEERAKLIEQNRQLHKLESLGVLAGGIAHDFNNLMGGVFGYMEMAREISRDEKVTQYLSKAINTIHRAQGLTGQLLTFAKGGAPVQKIGSLFPFIEETTRFVLSGSSIACRFDVADNLSQCNFDENQIGQVIDNIVINAQQGMPLGGTIEVAAKNLTVGTNHLVLQKGDYVKISIKDTGIGIPKEILPNIFDPFFTTKAKGHGLGLATCYSIIKRHSGTIDVESEPGKGTTFNIYLPAATEPVETKKQKALGKHTGSGRILVVDDEVVMRESIGDMLEMFGYEVILKEEGRSAIDYFEAETKDNHPLAAILLDLTIPGGMGGRDSILEIRVLNAAVPVFALSGYAEDPVMASPGNYGFTDSLCKPFKIADLAAKLNKYL